MEIVISNASSKPIYEQIASQIRAQVATGELEPGQKLPSIRALAASLRVSAITTKRAYSDLESQGYVETVPGKGCFVAQNNAELLREDRLRKVEAALGRAVAHARLAGLTDVELHEMLDLMLEDEDDDEHR